MPLVLFPWKSRMCLATTCTSLSHALRSLAASAQQGWHPNPPLAQGRPLASLSFARTPHRTAFPAPGRHASGVAHGPGIFGVPLEEHVDPGPLRRR